MEQAKKELEDALAQLEKEFDRAKLIDKLIEVEKALKEMLRIQADINKTTVEHDDIRVRQEIALNIPYKFTRSEMLRLTEIKEDEHLLAGSAEKMSKLLEEEGKMVFPYILNIVRDDMLRVVELLGLENPDVGNETQTIEKDIMRNLERLLEAVREDLESLKEAQKKQQQQQQQQQQKKQEDKKQALLPGLAEIKLLKFLEEAIKSDTVEIDKKYPAGQDLKSFEAKLKQRICERLAGRQSKIQGMTAKILEQLEAAQR
jgi:hypothetical protein